MQGPLGEAPGLTLSRTSLEIRLQEALDPLLHVTLPYRTGNAGEVWPRGQSLAGEPALCQSLRQRAVRAWESQPQSGSWKEDTLQEPVMSVTRENQFQQDGCPSPVHI